MRDIVVAHVPRGRAVRILDLGCGTGSLVFRLADALPSATLVGIDVSPANIDAANAARRGPAAGRTAFVVADYLRFHAPAFDVVVTDGVLHLIRADTAQLVAKLGSDVLPGGVLICAMPFDCAYNRVFAVVRRSLRPLRSRWLDAAILQTGRILHGRDMDDNGLRERVGYMYLPPERMMNSKLLAEFRRVGFRETATYPMKSTSASQLRHGVTVFKRDGSAPSSGPPGC